jgi:hypothetical protein
MRADCSAADLIGATVLPLQIAAGLAKSTPERRRLANRMRTKGETGAVFLRSAEFSALH